ncbi:triose-phosphate isomerase [bacterium]|nr:triose-phosphate isomerase [bacterium]
MQLTFAKTVLFCKKNQNNFELLTQKKNTKIVLCPSFESLAFVNDFFKKSSLSVGAQTCSSYEKGAYSGQVAAQSLSDIGCKYCLVGHSERRNFCSETDDDVAKKVQQLLKNNIIPIVCVGELKKEREEKKTYEVIERQIRAACQAVKKFTKESKIFIAYEPVWSIGTGDIPSNQEITEILKYITSIAKAVLPKISLVLLYGGSVHEKNVKILKEICDLDGFLVGGASLDFQKFQKIVT